MTTEKMSYAYLFKYIIIGDTGKYPSSIWKQQKGCYLLTICDLMKGRWSLSVYDSNNDCALLCHRCGEVVSPATIY